MTSTTPLLHYYNGFGRGENTRLLLTFAGIHFDEIKHKYPLPDEERKIATYGQLPLYIDDDIELVQSAAIEYYLANKYNLAGDTLVDRAQILSISLAVNDFLAPYFAATTDEKKLKFEKVLLPRLLSAWEKILTQNGGQHMVGNQWTWADVSVFFITDYLKIFGYSDQLVNYPNLCALKSKFASIPSIADYLSKRPKPDY